MTLILLLLPTFLLSWGGCLLLGVPFFRNGETEEVPLGQALAVGLALWGCLHFLMGILGWLSPWSLGFTTLALGGMGLRIHGGLIWDRGRLWILAALPSLFFCLYPSVAFDATFYHLPYAQAFVESGHLPFLETLRYPVFPQLGELLYLVGWPWLGEGAARLSQALAFWGTGILLYEGIDGPSDSKTKTLALLLWWGTPMAFWLGTVAYVDAVLTLMITAAWVLLRRPETHRRGILLGIVLGAAVSTKYLGLFFAAVVGLGLLAEGLKSRRWKDFVGFGGTVFGVAGPWYLRNTLSTGNPLFPFYPEIFGSNPWVVDYASKVAASGAGAATRLIEAFFFLLLTPWNSWFQREIFHYTPPLHPLWFALPLLLLLSLWRSKHRVWIGVILTFSAFWLTAGRDLRYLLPILPLLCMVSAEEIGRWPLGARTFKGIAILSIAPTLIWIGYRIDQQGFPPVSPDARRTYIESVHPASAALFSLGDNPEVSVYGLYGENLAHFAPGPYYGDLFGPFAFSRVETARSRGRAAVYLQSFGVDYLLVLRTPSRPFEAWATEPGFEVNARHPEWILLKVKGNRGP